MEKAEGTKHVVDTLEVESGWLALKGHDPNRRMVKATLVLGEERVFTESEVKAMMEDVAHCITWPEAKGVLRRKYGLVLDPA